MPRRSAETTSDYKTLLEDAQRHSGMNVGEFCTALGIQRTRYYYIKDGSLPFAPDLAEKVMEVMGHASPVWLEQHRREIGELPFKRTREPAGEIWISARLSGTMLAAMRVAAGISASSAAKLLNVAEKTLKKMENDEVPFSVKQRDLIIAAAEKHDPEWVSRHCSALLEQFGKEETKRRPPDIDTQWNSCRSPGEKIRLIRLAMGKTTHELAQLMGCNQSTVSEYENNDPVVPEVFIRTLAAKSGLTWLDTQKVEVLCRETKAYVRAGAVEEADKIWHSAMHSNSEQHERVRLACRAARLATGLDIKAFCQAGDIPYATYQNFERGSRLPRKGTLKEITTALVNVGHKENPGWFGVDRQSLLNGLPESLVVHNLDHAANRAEEHNGFDSCIAAPENVAKPEASNGQTPTTRISYFNGYAADPDASRIAGSTEITPGQWLELCREKAGITTVNGAAAVNRTSVAHWNRMVSGESPVDQETAENMLKKAAVRDKLWADENGEAMMAAVKAQPEISRQR